MTTLHYLSPPYWQTEGYGVEFPWADQLVSLSNVVDPGDVAPLDYLAMRGLALVQEED